MDEAKEAEVVAVAEAVDAFVASLDIAMEVPVGEGDMLSAGGFVRTASAVPPPFIPPAL